MSAANFSKATFLGKLFRLPLHLIPANASFPILRTKLRGKRWIVGSAFHSFWLGFYEYDLVMKMEKIIKEGSFFFDIGAHVGFFTLLGSVLVGNQGKVFAFEPLPRNISYLDRHLKINNIKNVNIIEAAVSDVDGFVTFDEYIDHSRGKISNDGKFKVRSITLDAFIRQGESPIPDYIKIDVERAELSLLKGARGLLETYHPTLFLATHTENLKLECCKLLKDLGYKLEPIGSSDLKTTDTVLAYKNE